MQQDIAPLASGILNVRPTQELGFICEVVSGRERESSLTLDWSSWGRAEGSSKVLVERAIGHAWRCGGGEAGLLPCEWVSRDAKVP